MKNTIKTHLYKAENVNTGFGIFMVVVESLSEYDARCDISEVIHSEFNLRPGSFRINEVVKTTRKIVKNMHEVKGCAYHNEKGEKHQWGWISDRKG